MSIILPEHVHAILGKHMLADGYDFVLDLMKSKGSYLFDAKSGKYFLDFFTFYATSPIGYNHPEMTTDLFIKKLGNVSINKPSNSDVYTVEFASFVKTFSEIAMPDYLKYLFFISGGALAVENALKTAMDWKVRKNLQKGLTREKGQKIIHFQQAFHGRSGYTLSLTNTFDTRKTKYYPTFNWPRILNPKVIFPLNDENILRVQQLEARAIKDILRHIKEDGDDIAALIIEPIQGEGGDNHFRKNFFINVSKICHAHNILFILDEIQTGIGLTGKMWAAEHFDIKPDIICFGKKTQVCGIMVSNRIDEINDHVFSESSRINSTFGGNLTDMVRMEKYLEIIDREHLVANAEKMGDYLLQGLTALQKKFDDIISNTRGRGLMCAFDIHETSFRNRLVKQIYKQGVIVLSCGERSIRFRPALNIGTREIDQGIECIEKAINALLKKR